LNNKKKEITKTSTIKNKTINPKWNEEFIFTFEVFDDKIEKDFIIEVWDTNIKKKGNKVGYL
jgi:Ca2+-dependent lipid-binding protein